ncbi:MAG: hypothetical protein IJS54_01480 [Desulfovibrio sp.]|nr:hypothetical protein [Desulfovibrio sp.]
MIDSGLSVDTVKGSNLLLQDFGEKLVSGKELLSPQKLMAVTQTSMDQAGRYGPTPETFQVKPYDLPADTKGILVNYAL